MRLKIDKEKAKNWLRNSAGRLNKPYEPIKEKPIAILTTTGVLYTLGAFYLWAFFGVYNIDYFYYFDIKDSISVLYEKMMLIVFISILLAPVLVFLLPGFFVPNNKSNKISYFKYAYNYNNQNSEKDTDKNRFSNLSIIVIVSFILCGIWLFLSLYKLAPKYAIFFLFLGALSAYYYLYKSPRLGLLVLLALTFLLVYALGRIQALDSQKNKGDRKINIVLKHHSEIPILMENDRCKYLINKTSNYYFIKDECRHQILIYNISTGEMVSFTSK